VAQTGEYEQSPRPRLALGFLAMALLKLRSSFLHAAPSLCTLPAASAASSRICDHEVTSLGSSWWCISRPVTR